MAHFVGTPRNRFGEAVPRANVTVTDAGTSNLASLFSDEGMSVSLANPTQSSDRGIVDFYVANGEYDFLIQRFGIEDLFIGNIELGETVTSVTLLGDVSGTTDNNTVVAIQGNAVDNSTPLHGQFYVQDDNVAGGLVPRSLSSGEGIDFAIGNDGSTTIAAEVASTINRGVVELATSAETTDGLAVQASDTRLSDARAPTGPAGGDLSGTYANPSVAAIQGTAVSGLAPTDGDLLRYVAANTQWEPDATLQGDVTTLQSSVATLQSEMTVVQADAEKVGEVFIPAPDFVVTDDPILGTRGTNPRPGATAIGSFGGNAQTLPFQLFDNITSGTATCVAWSRQQVPSWDGQVFEVVFLGASHVTTLPLPRNFRILVDVHPVDEPANHLEQTLTLNFSGQEHVMGTFTATANPFGPFQVAVRRDYDHVDDSGELMYFAGILLRLVNP